MHGLTIRAASAADAAAVARLADEFHAYLKDCGATTEFHFTAATFLRDGFAQSPAFKCLVAESRHDIIGYLILHFSYDTDHSRREAYVDDLYVQNAWRGHGVGKSLLLDAARVAKAEHGAEGLWWGVHNGNAAAFRFYESLGAKYVTGLRFMSIDNEQLESRSG